MDLLLMGIILAFIGVVGLVGIKMPSRSLFFSRQDTTAMRGIMCLIIPFAHVPYLYQNTIQNMISSFGFVGVTFFFMVSAYGLKMGIMKNPDSLNSFWRRRLPRILVTILSVNIIMTLLFEMTVPLFTFQLHELFWINLWVQQLLIFYFIFWLTYQIGFRLNISTKVIDLIIILLIVGFSLFIYLIPNQYIWVSESFGFIWGLLLARHKAKIMSITMKTWQKLIVVFTLASGFLGLLYLKFSYIPFAGDYLLKVILGASILTLLLFLNTKFHIGNQVSLFLGKVSFEVYLVHELTFHLVSQVYPDLSSSIFMIVCLSLTVFMSAFIGLINNFIFKLFDGSFVPSLKNVFTNML